MCNGTNFVDVFIQATGHVDAVVFVAPQGLAAATVLLRVVHNAVARDVVVVGDADDIPGARLVAVSTRGRGVANSSVGADGGNAGQQGKNLQHGDGGRRELKHFSQRDCCDTGPTNMKVTVVQGMLIGIADFFHGRW